MDHPSDQVPAEVQSPLDASSAAADDRFGRYVVPEIEVLLRVANPLTRNHAEAEDLVQDTLLRAFRAIDSFDGPAPASLAAHDPSQHAHQPEPPAAPRAA